MQESSIIPKNLGPYISLRSLMLATALTGLMSGLAAPSAMAQQAYFRGEAQSDNSVIVNLSVIERLTSGVPSTGADPQAPLPRYVPSPSAPAMPSQPAMPSRAMAPEPPPTSMPQSTLLVPQSSAGASTPPPAPAAAAPPPKPVIAAKPVPAPAPAPTPAPAPPKPASTSAPEPAPAPPEPVATAPAPAVAPESEITAAAPPPTPIPTPPPPSPSVSEPEEEPAPQTVTAPPPAPPAPPAETPESDTAVASVDLSAVDVAGIQQNEDGLSVLFTSDSQDLPIAAEGALAEIAGAMKANPSMSLKLLGYSEKIGDTPSKPRRLSLFRALAVRTYLLKQGIDSRRMTVQALGAKDEGNGRPANRVDLVVSQS